MGRGEAMGSSTRSIPDGATILYRRCGAGGLARGGRARSSRSARNSVSLPPGLGSTCHIFRRASQIISWRGRIVGRGPAFERRPNQALDALGNGDFLSACGRHPLTIARGFSPNNARLGSGASRNYSFHRRVRNHWRPRAGDTSAPMVGWGYACLVRSLRLSSEHQARCL
jgi:hypothetical protein